MSVTFSPDGTTVLSGSADHTLKLWDVATGQLLHTFEGHDDSVSSVAYSPDGRQVLSGSRDRTLKLWDATSGQLLRSFESQASRINAVAFSPDGARLLSGGDDNSWMEYSPDGKRQVGSRQDLPLKLWDAASGQVLRTFKKIFLHNVFAVAFSPDGARLLSAGGDDHKLELWDASTGQLLNTLQGHTSKVRCAVFSPDGTQVLSGSEDKTLKLWDASSGLLLRTFEGHDKMVLAVAFSPDGTRVLSGGYDKALKVWDVASGQSLRTIQAHADRIYSVAFSPDGARLLSGSEDKSLKLWDATSGQLLLTFGGDSDKVSSVAPSAGDNGVLRISAVALSPDGTRVLSGSEDKTVKLWDATSGQLLRTFRGHRDSVESVAFSPDGTRVLSGSKDRTLKLWDAASGQVLQEFVGHTGFVRSVAFSHDGTRVLSGGTDHSAKLWDVVSGQLLQTFLGYSAGLSGVAFSIGDSSVLAGRDGSILHGGGLIMWDVSGRLAHEFGDTDVRSVHRSRRQNDRINAVAFSPDGLSVVAGGHDQKLRLWDIVTEQPSLTFAGHTGEVTSVAFSPDGKRLLSGSQDHTLKLWNAADGTLIRTFAGHLGAVSSVAFSPDGKRAISGGNDATIRIWNVETGELLATLLGSGKGEALAITPTGFFAASRRDTTMLAIVGGLQVVATIGQMHQSLFNPDLVREMLAGDPDGAVKRSGEVMDLDKVIDSGPAPLVEITSHPPSSTSETDLVTAAALITDRGKGIGRIEWRVNGVTTGVTHAPANVSSRYEVKQTLALDPGDNIIEVRAYNARNLFASLPAQASISFAGRADNTKPKLYMLAIGIDAYQDKGSIPPGGTRPVSFPPLKLAAGDATAFATEIRKAAEGLYSDVRVTTALDSAATAAGLDEIVRKMSAEITPRDTFVLFAAGHGYSLDSRFYLIPQDYQGGIDPTALANNAINQERLQDWIANKIKARKAVILLDTCESGALVEGYTRSRADAPASEAAIGRLNEATGRPVLTAAAEGKPAFEGYQGHGVFTWALIDALHHGDTNGNGIVELSELVSHVQNTVPKISAELNGAGRAAVGMLGSIANSADSTQSAHFGSTGEDFPLVKRLP